MHWFVQGVLCGTLLIIASSLLDIAFSLKDIKRILDIIMRR